MFYTAHWEILLSWGVFFSLHSLLNWPNLLQCVEEWKIQLRKTQTICFIHPRCQTNSAELTLTGKNLCGFLSVNHQLQRRFSKSYIFLGLYNRSPSCFWQKQSPLTVPPTACLNIRPNSAGILAGRNRVRAQHLSVHLHRSVRFSGVNLKRRIYVSFGWGRKKKMVNHGSRMCYNTALTYSPSKQTLMMIKNLLRDEINHQITV